MSDVPKPKMNIYYDGSCPMCTAIIDKVGDTSKASFTMVDITKNKTPPEFTKEDVLKEIYVVDSNGKIYKNAEGILAILDVHFNSRFFIKIGRVFVLRQILHYGYGIISRNRHFLFGPMSRVFWTKAVVAFGLISGILLSLKLWVNSRTFPLTPVIDVAPLPYPLDYIVLSSALLALVVSIFSSRPKIYLLSIFGLFCLLFFFDQQRLQPWAYQYTVMLLVLGLFSWRRGDILGKNKVLNISRFIVATIYFWSGFQKMNPVFITTVFPWMVSPIANLFPYLGKTPFLIFGALVPLIEMAIGIGLITKKFRTVSVFMAICMCMFVLFTIGPWGHNWNSVVWPWNVTILLLVVILFIKSSTVSVKDILWNRGSRLHQMIIVLFGIMPALYFFNVSDSYLSWSLYSGTINDGILYVSDDVKNKMPSSVQDMMRREEGRNSLVITKWAFTELNTPAYPEKRVFMNIAKNVCKLASLPTDVELLLRGRASWFYSDTPERLNCSSLD